METGQARLRPERGAAGVFWKVDKLFEVGRGERGGLRKGTRAVRPGRALRK